MGLDAADTDRLADELIFWGDPGTVAARIGQLHEAGADHVILHVLSEGGQPGPIEAARALADQSVSGAAAVSTAEGRTHGTARCALRDHRDRPARLRGYFGELFGWKFDTSAPVAAAVSEPDNYGFVTRATTPDGTGIPGGVGGGRGYHSQVLFYVGVPNVEAALERAESLGGKRVLGPERAPTGLIVGHFTDPEGNLIGVAGTA